MQPHFTRKLKTLALICVFTCIAGVIYQFIKENFVNEASIQFGLPLGLVFGLMELFLLPVFEKRFRRWPFTWIFFFKTVLYTIIIYVVTIAIMTIAGVAEGRTVKELAYHLTSLDHYSLVAYTLVVYAVMVFFLQVNHLLGEGVLWKFLRGKYHQPREEERIFMFLDMKSSTTIAEQLGHVKFYALLNELFHEISQPVLETKAEIYQYVGDEVILTWPVKNGLENSNCIKAFFLFQEKLRINSENYRRNFGVVPSFKAGLHSGTVISAQIGDLKREIVYNGDVLNTASRIQNECNTYQKDCLISGTLRDSLRHLNGFVWEKINTVTLRGKETEVELFSVVNSHA
jgi:adenylate cyclase